MSTKRDLGVIERWNYFTGTLNTYDYYVKNHYGKRWTTFQNKMYNFQGLMQTIVKILMKW